MTEKKRICILSFSTIAWDSRVLREVEMARKFYVVDVIAYGEWLPPEGVRYFRLAKTRRNIWKWLKYIFFLLTGRLFNFVYEHAFWMHQEYHSAQEILLREEYHLIHANDWNGLPVAVSASRLTGSRVLFDAHEYSLAEEADKPMWSLIFSPYRDYLFRTYQNPVNSMITVSSGIKDLYRQTFGWNMEEVLNAPSYWEAKFHPAGNSRIRIVHHGAALPPRKLEYLIELVSMLDRRYELSLFLIPSNPHYLERLKRRAEKIVPGRVHFRAPVSPKDALLAELELFDIGIPPIVARQLNDFNALPNKFFDFIMSGLAIAVSPLPMMQKIVLRHKIGIVAEDQTPQSMAQALNALSADEINKCKLNSLNLAKSMNAETEGGKLLNIYQKIIESR